MCLCSATPSRRSALHSAGLDGAATSDEDFLTKAMRRKEATNLDFAGTNNSSKSFLTFPTLLIAANLNKWGFHWAKLLILFLFGLVLLDVWNLIISS
jgi:hypothetical protein